MSARTLKQLLVLLEGQPAGRLNQDVNGRLSFQYDESYPSDATPLSPALPIVGHRFTHRDVAPFVVGLLPDNEQVLERWAQMFGVRAGNAFALLAHVGTDCAGAVQFVPEDRVASLDDGALVEHSDADVGLMLRDLRSSPTTWQQPDGARGGHFSLAGAQTKFALHRTDSGWARPTGRIPTTHIFKPAIAGIADHDINEHLCLSAARLLGLLAAHSELTMFGEERAIVVTRYDRREVAGTIRRLHQVDMCQARGVMPELKYERDGGPGPADIIATLRDTLAGEDDVARFVRSLVFNWVIGGTDAHAKNYGLLLSGTASRLTPLYDVATATVFDEWDPHKWELAMRVHKQGRFKYLTGGHWRKFANRVGVDADLIRDAADVYCDRIGDVLVHAGTELPAAHRSYVARLTDAVASHAASVRRLL